VQSAHAPHRFSGVVVPQTFRDKRSGVNIASELQKLSTGENTEIRSTLAIELAKSGVQFDVENLNEIKIEQLVHVSPNLNEEMFFSNLQSVNNACLISKNFILWSLAKITMQHQP
jgi:hypothetical protein